MFTGKQSELSSLFMGSVLKLGVFRKKPADLSALATEFLSEVGSTRETALLRTIGWLSAGAGALALGLFIGRELRSRYKFNRRTPYDFYAHSGDSQEIEFGVGI